MIWHPFLMAVFLLDSLSFLLIAAAAWTALQVAVNWAPESSQGKQIKLEVQAESASLQIRGAAVAFFTSTLLLIIAVSNVLPAVVPGAMCGTGVLQACKGLGERALAFRLVAIGIFYVGYSLDRLNRTQPDSPLAITIARTTLLLSPILLLACLDSARMIFSLDTQQPVDCCVVVYDQVRDLGLPSALWRISLRSWLGAFFLGGALLLFTGTLVWRSSPSPGIGQTFGLALLSLLWLPIAYKALIKILAAYHYGVLFHHCPWCLFLPEHRLIGYPLYGALGVTCLEGCTALISLQIAKRFPRMAGLAVRRSRRAGLRVLIAAIFFLSLAGLPAIIWRLRFGVWM